MLLIKLNVMFCLFYTIEDEKVYIYFDDTIHLNCLQHEYKMEDINTNLNSEAQKYI